MKRTTEFYWVALTGLAMMLIAGYTQWISIDLKRFSLIEYATMDVMLWDWWSIVGIPFLAGFAYLGTAFVGIRQMLTGRTAIVLFVGCFAFAVILLLVVDGIGYFSTMSMAGLLLYVLLKSIKHN